MSMIIGWTSVVKFKAMVDWREEFSRLAKYEQAQRKKEINEQVQRKIAAKTAFCKMMDAYAAIRRAGYDVQVKGFDDTVWKTVHEFNLSQVETSLQ